MGLPLLVHVHVPKTAGSSFRTLLQKRFGPDHANLYWDNKPFEYTESYLDEFVSSRPTLRSISSHFIRTFPPRIAGREALYITFLRQPVEHFISYLTYTRKHFHEIPDRDLLGRVPPNVPELPLREFADWVLSRRVPFSQDYQVGFFTKVHFRTVRPDYDEELYRASRLLLAKTLLRQFFFTGIAERMDDSVDLLKQLGDRFGIEVPHGPVGVENVSNEYRDDLTWISAADEVGARLLASVAEDQVLYDWNVARFEQARAENATPTDRLQAIQSATHPPVVTQLYWSFADDDFGEARSVRERWVIGPEESLYRLEMPRFETVPARLRLDLADRPIHLLVSRLALLDAAGEEVWRLCLRTTTPEQLCMAGMKLVADESTGETLAEIEDWDAALLLPVDNATLSRLNAGGAIEIVMSAQ